MLKIVFNLVRKVVFAFLILYGLDLLVNSLNVLIPINIFTLGTTAFLGIPGLLSLIAMFFIIR